MRLHVASGYSMRYGTASPHQLVERAAAFGQPALALTDRDGLYGAVKFVRACMEHDVAPILGVDLAIGPEQPERHRPVRTPVRRWRARRPAAASRHGAGARQRQRPRAGRGMGRALPARHRDPPAR